MIYVEYVFRLIFRSETEFDLYFVIQNLPNILFLLLYDETLRIVV